VGRVLHSREGRGLVGTKNHRIAKECGKREEILRSKDG
jgi:hypothetical protein